MIIVYVKSDYIVKPSENGNFIYNVVATASRSYWKLENNSYLLIINLNNSNSPF